ncbi:hypothetical protein [Halocalculus aciditolerans]|uniref:Uncharacterized protein n=1 Tax=Halocalculus aciditolerans TaxID=1383812 RepID=A0A830FGZ9_9EURY|nr:hypothetical protein [Halocalculus aciditolerans]GGL73666.1 hypothetical protein GCM10009039_34710 [Halocalculus aciditolerans]
MTTRENYGDLVAPRELVRLADVDDVLGELDCTLCRKPATAGTPQIPADAFEADPDVDVDELPDSVPVHGARCSCRRDADVLLLTPADDYLPPNYTPVTAFVDGEKIDLAVPDPILE